MSNSVKKDGMKAEMKFVYMSKADFKRIPKIGIKKFATYEVDLINE